MTSSRQHKSRILPALKLSALAVGLAMAGSASAVQFKFDNGVSGSFDTTFSYGISIRTEDPDKSLIGIANGGTSRSVNEDDGTRNYKKNRPFANVVKGTHELSVKWEDWGFFARGTYFTDFENRADSRLGPLGQKRIGQDSRMLDAFISKSFDVLGNNARIRVGNQVISWGESTFIPNGINVINAVDLVKLRTPGSELKEAFLPTTSIWGSFELTKNASLEAYALLNHDKVKLDPRGSYWSNNDFASDDSDRVFVGFGRRADLTNRAPLNPSTNAAAVAAFGPFSPIAQSWAPRGADVNPSDSGQFGVALRYLATDFNNTEFAVYFQKYHSRIPLFSGIKGTASTILGTGSAVYFAEFPEDIKLYGLSFNTQGPFGIAVQGEYSYRPNQPLQYSTPELLLAALGAPNLITGFRTIEGTTTSVPPYGVSAAGLVPNGTYQRGWDRTKMSQLQVTATKSIPSILGAEQAIFVGEVGFTKFHSFRTDVKYNGPAVFLPATIEGANVTGAGDIQREGFTTANSWGYRLVGRLEYANAFLGSNFAPRIAFNHDVSGVSPTFNEGVKSVSVGANVDYQRKLAFDLSYTSFFGGRTYCGTDRVDNLASTNQQILGLQIQSQGASYCSSANPIKDRDFVSFTVSYSF